MQNNYNKEEIVYAGFWVRAGAYALDNIIVFFGLLVVRLFLAGISGIISDTPLGGNLIFQYTLKDITLYIFHVLYFILFTYYTGTTLGKRAMNLRVTAAEGKLTFLDVLYRETVGRFLCSISISIGYIMVGIDSEKRGLHDILCDTRVVYAKKVKIYPAYQAPVPVQPAMRPTLQPGPYRMAEPAEEQEIPKENCKDGRDS